MDSAAISHQDSLGVVVLAVTLRQLGLRLSRPQVLLVLSWPPFGQRAYLLGGLRMYTTTRRCLSFPQLRCSHFIPSPENIACVMGYIVDLTIVMRKLSDVDLDISKESIASTLEDFTQGDITNVHHDIRQFLTTRSTVSLANKDSALDEIINLIHKYCK
jgi:hypothetical protein